MANKIIKPEYKPDKVVAGIKNQLMIAAETEKKEKEREKREKTKAPNLKSQERKNAL